MSLILCILPSFLFFQIQPAISIPHVYCSTSGFITTWLTFCLILFNGFFLFIGKNPHSITGCGKSFPFFSCFYFLDHLLDHLSLILTSLIHIDFCILCLFSLERSCIFMNMVVAHSHCPLYNSRIMSVNFGSFLDAIIAFDVDLITCKILISLSYIRMWTTWKHRLYLWHLCTFSNQINSWFPSVPYKFLLIVSYKNCFSYY